MRFDQLYRPQRFSDVYGQGHVVKLIKSLISRNKLQRNLLLCGDRGSGKTTIARLYASALNCDQNLNDGSPCGICKACTDPDRDGLFEYDTPVQGGEKANIEAFVYAATRSLRDCKVRVLFFDEAHALTKDAADVLLKRIEDGTEGIVFCFATTAPSKLSQALISRLMVHTVRALSHGVAITFLRDLAARANIDCESEALSVLAAAKRNYPRDLVIGLEQVAVPGKRLTAAMVKDAFGIDQAEVLAAYFTALGRGDADRQAKTLEKWQERPLLKAEWIRNFLLSLYYNNVLGQSVIVDPVVHAASDHHHAIVQEFKGRLQLTEAALAAYWVMLLEFWVSHRPSDDAAANLSIALFQHLINSGDLPSRETGSAAVAQHRGPKFDATTLWQPLIDEESDVEILQDFVGPSDVGIIVNRASSFMQHYGKPFNAALRVSPSDANRQVATAAVSEISAFLADFERECLVHASEADPFGAISLIEADEEDGYYALIAAHVPGFDTEKGASSLKSFIDKVSKVGHAGDGMTVEVALNRRGAAYAVDFHWDAVFDLCKSAHDPAEDSSVGGKGILDFLKIPRKDRRPSLPVTTPRIGFFGALTSDANRRAQALKMTFLSALDDRASRWIRSEWELEEFSERKATIADRQAKLAEIQTVYTDDAQARANAEAGLLASWPEDPKRRRHDWKQPRWWRG